MRGFCHFDIFAEGKLSKGLCPGYSYTHTDEALHQNTHTGMHACMHALTHAQHTHTN